MKKRILIEIRSYWWMLKDVVVSIKDINQYRKAWIRHMSDFSDRDLGPVWDEIMKKTTDARTSLKEEDAERIWQENQSEEPHKFDIN